MAENGPPSAVSATESIPAAAEPKHMETNAESNGATESADDQKAAAGDEDNETKAAESRWPEPIGSIRKAFKEDRRGAEFQRLITDQFSSAENPYEKVLELIERSPDIAQPKVNTMALAMLKDFATWIEAEGREEKFRHLLSLGLQHRAFEIATKKHTILLKTAVDVFHMTDEAHTFVLPVRTMVKRGAYREAAEIVTTLGIQDHFGLDEIIIPCILQDKINFVEPYLEGKTALQQELVKVLDELCAPNFNVMEFLARYNVAGVRRDKLCLKPVQKLIARYAKLYSIPAEKTPNLARARSQGALKYVLHRRYDEKIMHDDNFNDMVRQGIETCPALLEDLTNWLCFTYHDLPEAAKWAGYFGVPIPKLPPVLQSYVDEKPESLFPTNGVDKLEDASLNSVLNGEYLGLPMPPSAVVMVQDESSLNHALEEIGKATIIGLDTEWQPAFGQAIENVALLQVATKSNAFLIDILTLKSSVSEAVLKHAMEKLFCEETPRKIGFGFGGDVKTLALTLPFCREVFGNVSNTVCVSELIKNLLKENLDFVAGIPDLRLIQQQNDTDDSSSVEDNEMKETVVSSKMTFNLAELCHYLLGKPLDKSEQYSNWSRRPLRWHQMRYAALDAYCLIPIFEKLRSRAVELKIDFEKAVLCSLVKGSKAVAIGREKKSTATKKLERAELMELINKLNETIDQNTVTSVRRPADVRVVADSMVRGLGRHLRRCGIDCVLLKNHETKDKAIAIAKKEMRILLTSGNLITMAAAHLPSELICPVPKSSSAKDQLVWFLKKMQIRVTEEDIFSRCMICNCPDFINLPSQLLRVIYDAVVLPTEMLEPLNRQATYEVIQEYFQNANSSNEAPNGAHAVSLPSPPFGMNDEKWICDFDGTKIDLLTGVITPRESENTTRVQIESIPSESSFTKISVFYLCCECGKIYWDGKHLNRYMSKLHDVVELDQSDGSDKEAE